MFKNILFVSFAFCSSCWATYWDFAMKPNMNSDHLIPTKIISNYLEKYFINKNVFVVIYSAAASEDQREVQQDSISGLTQSAIAMKFSFEIMTKPTEEEFKFRSAFSLIMVDNSIAFR